MGKMNSFTLYKGLFKPGFASALVSANSELYLGSVGWSSRKVGRGYHTKIMISLLTDSLKRALRHLFAIALAIALAFAKLSQSRSADVDHLFAPSFIELSDKPQLL